MTDRDAIVFVVDDDQPNRDALGSLIRSAGLAVRAFSSAEEFLGSERPEAPACLVLDVRLPGLSGLDLQRELLTAGIRIPVIFITAYGDIGMSVQAMKSGAVEFLTKPVHPKVLVDAVRQAIEQDRTARHQQMEELALRRRFESLSPREQQVMGLVVAGLLNKQIAVELGTSEITVKVHRAQVIRKMGAASLPQLVRMAATLGIPITTK